MGCGASKKAPARDQPAPAREKGSPDADLPLGSDLSEDEIPDKSPNSKGSCLPKSRHISAADLKDVFNDKELAEMGRCRDDITAEERPPQHIPRSDSEEGDAAANGTSAIVADADKDLYAGMASSIGATSLEPGAVKTAIVLGAGASGLACARALADRGVEVTLLEGRDRLGGRLYTDANGLDIGGHWIHGGGVDESVPDYSSAVIQERQTNPVRLLCDEFGIETVLTDGDSCYIGESEARLREIAFHMPDGRPMKPEEEPELWEVYETVISKVHDLEARMRKNNLPEANMSLDDAIRRVKEQLPKPLTELQEQYLQWHIETEFGGDCAEDPKHLSFWHYDGGAPGQYRTFAGGDRVLKAGYGALVDKLAEPLESRIQLNKIVTRISHTSEGAAVECSDGSSAEADVVVCTLPLGILKREAGKAGHVEFDPPLPPAKADAIARGRMGCLNKLFLVFDGCYWPEGQYTFGALNAKPDEFPSMLVNLMPSHGLPILTCMVGGGAGRAMEARPLADNVAWAMTLVRKLFGDAVKDPVDAIQTAWASDPFSYGAYSCAGRGMGENDMQELGEPVDGRVFFAGEHTNALFWGSVHGAIVSGWREAARITGDMAILPGKAGAVSLRTKKAELRAKKAQALATRVTAITEAFQEGG